MIFLKILDQLKSLVKSHAGVEMAFGQPTTISDMTVIPVAKVSFGIGGGGGKSGAASKEEAADETKDDATPQQDNVSEGGGGGGGFKTQPVGIYAIKGDKVKFYPVIAFEDLIKVIAIVSLLIWSLTKRKKVKKEKIK